MINICEITEAIQEYKSISKKKNQKYYEIALFAKFEINSKEALISKALINSVISHDYFVLMNNVLREYNDYINEYNDYLNTY